MRKSQVILVLLFCLCSFTTFAQLGKLKNKIKKSGSDIIQSVQDSSSNLNGSSLEFTQEEAAAALKEALNIGAEKSIQVLSKENGFYKNLELKIPFPEEAKKMESQVRKIPIKGNTICDDAILTMNRSAEIASKEAKKIFLTAINEMTVQDAIAIVKGAQNAATNYLNNKTADDLRVKFRPIIDSSLAQTGATKHWKKVITAYNKLPTADQINPDLGEYVTNKTIGAVFIMIAKEELKIRQDLDARTTELLKKIFG